MAEAIAALIDGLYIRRALRDGTAEPVERRRCSSRTMSTPSSPR